MQPERESVNSSTSSSLLARLDKEDLKLIKVAIRRHNITDTFDPQPILRSLDDPFSLVVHRKGEGQRPIFQRKEIVNKEEYLEERTILKSPGHGGSRRSQSSESSRSCSRSEKLDSFKDEDAARTDDKHRRLEKQDDLYKKKYSRSRSPKDYGRSSQKYERISSRTPSRQRERSPPLRLGEYRPPECSKDSSLLPGPSKQHTNRYRRSPSHRQSKSPDVAHRNRLHRKRSPYYRIPNYKRRNSKSLSPPRKYRRTPERGDSCRHSPSKRKRSHYRHSPERRSGDRKQPSYRNSRNSSRSPDERVLYRGTHPYHDNQQYWFPSPLSHPGFIPKGFVPPMMRMIAPFPFGQPVFHPRPPIIYNQPYRPRIYPSTTLASASINTTVQSKISNAETTVTTTSATELKTDDVPTEKTSG